MANAQVMLFAGFLFFAFVQTGSSLKCFNCTQATNKLCKDYFTKSVPIIECAPGLLCTKHQQPAISVNPEGTNPTNLTAIIIRGCKPIDYCKTVEHFSNFCSGCVDDLCNSSSVVIPSIVMLFAALLLNNKLRIV